MCDEMQYVTFITINIAVVISDWWEAMMISDCLLVTRANSNWSFWTMRIPDRSLGMMVKGDGSLGTIVISDWLGTTTISHWFCTIVVNDWSLGTLVISDWPLKEVVMNYWLGTIVISYWSRWEPEVNQVNLLHYCTLGST